MKRVSRRHAAHRKELQLARLAFQFRYGFEPIHLRLPAPVVALRHEHHPPALFLFPFPHVLPYGDLRDRKLRMLFAQPRPDPMRRVPLLPRRLPIGFQHPLDGFLQGTDLRLLPCVLLSPWRDRARDGLAHHPPMHAMFPG